MKIIFKILLAFLVCLFLVWLLFPGWGETALMTGIALTAALYLLGLVRLWRSAGVGRGTPAWRAGCFLGGMILLALSLSTPMDRLADRAFSIHMIQHVLLMKVIPPLLLLGEFTPVFLWAVGKETARWTGRTWARSHRLDAFWKGLSNPWSAWLLFTACLWIWHVPAFYQAALKNEQVHALEHASFLASSLLFWWFLVKNNRDGVTRYGTAVLYLFATLMQESGLGALLTFSSANWYSYYSSFTNPWGLSPLADQQLAGMLMWLPIGALFTFLALYYFGSWLKEIEKRTNRTYPEFLTTGDRHE
jgi:putative membrane protein